MPQKPKASNEKPYRFADLFSGAGGMSFGFVSHPAFRPVLAIDAQKGKPSSGEGALQCNQTYSANVGIPVHEADLSKLDPKDILNLSGLRRGELDVLIACAPCTGFSRTLRKNHLEDDPRNSLVQRVGLFVEAAMPKVLVMENARELIRGNFAHHYALLSEHLRRLGYAVSGEVDYLSRFGLPQIRERALVVACRDNEPTRTLRDLWHGHTVAPDALTVRRAIAHLPPLAAGEQHPSDRMHVSPKFGSEVPLERLRVLPHDGGSWVDLLGHPNADALMVPSMKRSAAQGDFGSHPDVYGRLWWDRPCVTIKRECAHVGNGRYSHPEQDRQCTVREMALMSGFPATYTFEGGSLSNKYRHIGDAVPPLISYQLAGVCDWILSGRRPALEDCILTGTSLRPTDIQRKANEELSLLELAEAG